MCVPCFVLFQASRLKDSIGTDAACRCGLRMRQAACVLFDSMCAEWCAFYLSFPQTTICNWRRVGPRLQRLDDVMNGKLSCNRL